MESDSLIRVKPDAVKIIPIREIKLNSENRNLHPPDQIDRLAKMIQANGFRNPIIISNQSEVSIAGEGRVLAALKLGMTHVPVIFQDFDSPEQEYQFGVGDNAIAAWSTLDYSKIHHDIGDLGPFDIELLGIRDFAVVPAEKLQPQCGEDEVPEKVEPKTKLGDIYQLGNHRLMCGDSTSIDAVEKLMNGEKADMVFTDPPYGMNLDTNYDQMFGSDSLSLHERNCFQKVRGDDVDYDPNPIFAIEAKEYFIWGADYFYDKLPPKGSLIAWDKRDENLDKVPGNTTEFCWSKNPHRRMSIRLKWSGHHGMQKDDTRSRVHPTQKPTALAEWFLEQWGKGLKNIVDIYGGSGSTLIACEKTQRKCFMCELDPHYCTVIIERWCRYTGKEAYLLNENGTQTAWSEIKLTNQSDHHQVLP